MKSRAVVIEQPGTLSLTTLDLISPAPDDVVVAVDYSGISTGTERLLFEGRMPSFPGMGYPLVPGYESTGRIVDAGDNARQRIGERVFVPGSSCFVNARGLFGANAQRLVVPSARATTIADDLAEQGVLLALAATACHALFPNGHAAAPVLPELIVGHGVLGRLLARLVLALDGSTPTVWENEPRRTAGAAGYTVCRAEDDTRRDYPCIVDASGQADLLDTLIGRLARQGEIVLAGFYADRPSFGFAPAFMREARFRIAAEWQAADLSFVLQLLSTGRLSLDGLISHRYGAEEAATAYDTAFGDAESIKTLLDWRVAP